MKRTIKIIIDKEANYTTVEEGDKSVQYEDCDTYDVGYAIENYLQENT